MQLGKQIVRLEDLQDDAGIRVWLEEEHDVEPGKQRAGFRVRSAQYQPYVRRLEKIMKPKRGDYARGKVSSRQTVLFDCRAIAEKGVPHAEDDPGMVGIEDDAEGSITGKPGEPIPYSVANVRKVLESSPEVYQAVTSAMADQEAHAAAAREREKNSSKRGPSGKRTTRKLAKT